MERFSNNREAFWNQLKLELFGSKDANNLHFRYLEMGQLLQHGFSLSLHKEETNKLTFILWNADFDRSRFNKGVYNLDRLAITTKSIILEDKVARWIATALKEDFQLREWGRIVLDGLYCQIDFNDQQLTWNTEDEINEPLIELVKVLRKIATAHERD